MPKLPRILIQASGEGRHAELLKITSKHHRLYAEKHGADYWNCSFPNSTLPLSWRKLLLIQKAFRDGYDQVVWMDADSTVLDLKADIFKSCFHGIGLVRYDKPYTHYQCGVMVLWRESEVISLVAHVLDSAEINTWDGEGNHGRYGDWEQHPINLFGVERGIISSIHPRWNCVRRELADPCDNPAIISTHGHQPFEIRIQTAKETVMLANSRSSI